MTFFPGCDEAKDADARRVKYLRLSYGTLLHLLRGDGGTGRKIAGLPDDARILHAENAPLPGPEEVRLKVWSASFPVVNEGAFLEELNLTVHEVYWAQEIARLLGCIGGGKEKTALKAEPEESPSVCPDCKGTKVIVRAGGNMLSREECKRCAPKKWKCDRCQGKGSFTVNGTDFLCGCTFAAPSP